MIDENIASMLMQARKILDDQPVPGATPMFTMTHYQKIAAVIHARRVKIKSTGLTPNPLEIARLQAVTDLTKDLMDMFAADNRRFNALLFIEASSKDLV